MDASAVALTLGLGSVVYSANNARAGDAGALPIAGASSPNATWLLLTMYWASIGCVALLVSMTAAAYKKLVCRGLCSVMSSIEVNRSLPMAHEIAPVWVSFTTYAALVPDCKGGRLVGPVLLLLAQIEGDPA